jgi:hypothetical protein
MPLLGEAVTRAAAKLGVDPVKPITSPGVAALGAISPEFQMTALLVASVSVSTALFWRS